jgi:hypothetical protein
MTGPAPSLLQKRAVVYAAAHSPFTTNQFREHIRAKYGIDVNATEAGGVLENLKVRGLLIKIHLATWRARGVV